MSVIIDGKNKLGVRVSASVPDFMYQMYEIETKGLARQKIREFMAESKTVNSESVQALVLMSICKPSILKVVLGH